ncbi:MAG: DUF4870 domain-containing protein [Anaerolineales bacterium]
MKTTPTTEDRIWAILSHLSALAFGMGIVLPIIGWSDQRRKSNHATFQTLQALGYQSLGFTVWVFSYLVIIIVLSIILLAVLGSEGGSSQNMDAVLNPWLIVIFTVVFGGFALYLLLPIIAAVACAFGRDFRYPIMGNRLSRYLEYDPTQKSDEDVWLNEDHEFRWVAAMGHVSILILLWGMLAPLAVWMLQGKQSLFLKFQSIQTLVYQAFTTVIYLIGGFLYLFGFLWLIIGMGGSGELHPNSWMGIVSIIVFGVCLLISFVLILSVPLLHILGQWAGYRVLKGDDYRYPLVGRLVEKWISKNSTTKEKIS